MNWDINSICDLCFEFVDDAWSAHSDIFNQVKGGGGEGQIPFPTTTTKTIANYPRFLRGELPISFKTPGEQACGAPSTDCLTP